MYFFRELCLHATSFHGERTRLVINKIKNKVQRNLPVRNVHLLIYLYIVFNASGLMPMGISEISMEKGCVDIFRKSSFTGYNVYNVSGSILCCTVI